MTPLQIQMMLHYHTRPTPYAEHEPEHANSSAVREQRNTLCDWGLLARLSDPNRCCVTDKGKAYVEHLCAVKVPVCVWVQPKGQDK